MQCEEADTVESAYSAHVDAIGALSQGGNGWAASRAAAMIMAIQGQQLG